MTRLTDGTKVDLEGGRDPPIHKLVSKGTIKKI
jgi:hypothetical protein